jgi:putative ABC transport system substrate-binding protein
VVFALVNEPVAQGFVASLARPGGNITGFTNTDFSMLGKWVELLKTMVPALDRVVHVIAIRLVQHQVGVE